MGIIEYLWIGIICLLMVAATDITGLCIWHGHKYGSDINGNGML
jgi:hypothetical protein